MSLSIFFAFNNELRIAPGRTPGRNRDYTLPLEQRKTKKNTPPTRYPAPRSLQPVIGKFEDIDAIDSA
jgi:hypothetical protein